MELDQSCLPFTPAQLQACGCCAALPLLYQPIASLQHGVIIGVSVRCARRPIGSASTDGLGPVDPGQPIGHIECQLLRRACQDMRTWREAGLPAVRLAVTLAAGQLCDPGLPDEVAALLAEFAIDPPSLVLEIAATMLATDVASAAALPLLRALGVELALVQFGTGTSSLSHLERFPIGAIKIDRAVGRDVASNADNAARVKTIIAMAHHLGLQVVADGVDSEIACDFLRRNMCDHIQGEFFSAAVEAHAIAAMLAAQLSLPSHLRRFPGSRNRTLLLVDDEPNIVSALKRLLRPDGYQILSASGGAEGLEILARNEVDVIVSDQRMPGMLGADFLRAAKGRYPHTIRIMLSGYTELQSVTAAVNEGAIYKFLTKPWEDAQLRGHIADAFRLKEIADDNARLNLELRTANHELAIANRKMEVLLQQKQQQITLGEMSLNVARELLQFLPLPIIGLDDEGTLAFVNQAADTLFMARGAILGNEAALVLPELFAGGAPGSGAHAVTIDGRACAVLVHPMGSNSTSRGSLITITLTGEQL